MWVGVCTCAEGTVWVGERIASCFYGSWSNSARKRFHIGSSKKKSPLVFGDRHANSILREVWCHVSGLKSRNYQEPNLRETVSGAEERGNLACVGAAWVQLGEGSCPQREIETGYFWACPLSPRSHTIMHHPRPSLSTLIYLSLPQQGLVAQSPSRPLNSQFHVLHWRMGAGSLRLSRSREDLQKKMAASVVVPWFLWCGNML